MFISYKSIEMKDGEISYIPFLVNIDCSQCIYIEPIRDEKSTVFFGSQIVIDTGIGLNYIYGYSDEELNDIYNNIIDYINDEFEGVYKLPDVQNSLYRIKLQIFLRGIEPFDMIGNIDSIKYLKDRFSILQGSEARDMEASFKYSIYYHDIYNNTYKRISYTAGLKSVLMEELERLYKSIDDREACFKFKSVN